LFEIEFVARFGHLSVEIVFHQIRFAEKELMGILHKVLIILDGDFACARRTATLDLIEKAGARPAFIKRIFAGAQEERALKRIDRSVDGTCGGERPEVIPFPFACATMLDELRRRMVPR